MTWCEPLGLVGLAAFVEARVAEGRRVVVQAPLSVSVANYLSRMRMGRTLDALGAEHDLPVVHEWDVGDALLELESFDGVRGAERLAGVVHNAAEVIDAQGAATLYAALCEVGNNVPHHSGRLRGFMAAQWTHSQTQLHFAVGDSGVGMLSTLRSAGAINDATALTLALSPGASGTGRPERGVGLPDVRRPVVGLRGELHVLSGKGHLFARGHQQRVTAAAVPLQGTLVQGTIKIVGA